MGTLYSHLSQSDRLIIEAMHERKHSCRSIGRALGVSHTTVSREIGRGRDPLLFYDAAVGQLVAQRRRQAGGHSRRKLGANMRTPLWRSVLHGLQCGWSPQQIAGRLGHMPCPPALQDVSLSVSHETIYCAIYAMPRSALRTELVALLRKSHRARMPRARGQHRAVSIRGGTSISLRPPEVAARIVPGHWEGDLIKGAMNRSSVGTLVERVSRYLILAKMDSASSGDVVEAFTRRLRQVPAQLRKTLTYDQGCEMSQHATLTKRLNIDVYFCDPHSPWQRGSNENANGLVRQYLPKGQDLSRFTHQELSAIEHLLNNRPRKILGYRTPKEVFDSLKLSDISGVALQA